MFCDAQLYLQPPPFCVQNYLHNECNCYYNCYTVGMHCSRMMPMGGLLVIVVSCMILLR